MEPISIERPFTPRARPKLEIGPQGIEAIAAAISVLESLRSTHYVDGHLQELYNLQRRWEEKAGTNVVSYTLRER